MPVVAVTTAHFTMMHTNGCVCVCVCVCVAVCVPGSQQLMSPRLLFPISNNLGSVQRLRNLESKIKMFTKYF